MVADERLGVGAGQPVSPPGGVGAIATSSPLTPSFRLKRLCGRLKLNHWQRCVPHALEMRFELSGGLCVANYDQIVVLSSLATQTETRRSGSEQFTINLIRYQVHERAKSFDPNVVGKIAEPGEVVMPARIEHDVDGHAATIRVV